MIFLPVAEKIQNYFPVYTLYIGYVGIFAKIGKSMQIGDICPDSVGPQTPLKS